MHDEQDPFVANDDDSTVAAAAAITKQFDLDRLPASFQQFLDDNAIDPRIYTVSDLPRYVRLNTNAIALPSLDDLKEQLGTDDVWQVKDGIFGFLHAKHRLVDIAAYVYSIHVKRLCYFMLTHTHTFFKIQESKSIWD